MPDQSQDDVGSMKEAKPDNCCPWCGQGPEQSNGRYPCESWVNDDGKCQSPYCVAAILVKENVWQAGKIERLEKDLEFANTTLAASELDARSLLARLAAAESARDAAVGKLAAIEAFLDSIIAGPRGNADPGWEGDVRFASRIMDEAKELKATLPIADQQLTSKLAAAAGLAEAVKKRRAAHAAIIDCPIGSSHYYSLLLEYGSAETEETAALTAYTASTPATKG